MGLDRRSDLDKMVKKGRSEETTFGLLPKGWDPAKHLELETESPNNRKDHSLVSKGLGGGKQD